jgi:hypothetical protein
VREEVSEDLSRLSPRAARSELEHRFGRRLRALIVQAGANIVDVAEALGLRRQRLYDCMDTGRPFNAAWLPLLPPTVLRGLLEEIALTIGYELRPVAQLAEDHDDGREVVRIVSTSTEAMRGAVEMLADGKIDRSEAERLMQALQGLDEALAPWRARVREVLDHGGAVLPMRRGER